MLSYKEYLMEMAAAAYHGSPHDFDKFKKEHIGSGEGNQAYGYGLYFADAKEVAEWYRDKLSIEERYVDGEPLDVYNPKHHLALILAEESGDVQAAKETLEFLIIKGGSKSIKELAQQSLELLLKGITPQISYRKPKGKLYHVILQPDEDEYLLWDEPLNKQSDKVKELIEDRIVGYGNGEYDEYLDSTLADIYDMDLVDDPTLTGRDLYEKLSYNNNKQSDKRASEYLHSLGIRGIKYLDGTSRSRGKGNYNYVIFDEDDVVLQSKE